mmetsp:Transcript_42592/g.83774  ORF Transcript_42592/g.83774 Transcript_42592/m.83774 type:complete len:201 (+) Transcript_42592:1487-2089(+)
MRRTFLIARMAWEDWSGLRRESCHPLVRPSMEHVVMLILTVLAIVLYASFSWSLISMCCWRYVGRDRLRRHRLPYRVVSGSIRFRTSKKAPYAPSLQLLLRAAICATLSRFSRGHGRSPLLRPRKSTSWNTLESPPSEAVCGAGVPVTIQRRCASTHPANWTTLLCAPRPMECPSSTTSRSQCTPRSGEGGPSARSPSSP